MLKTTTTAPDIDALKILDERLCTVVRDNLETLYGAIGVGAIAVRIPKHARKELESYLDCGLLCRARDRTIRPA